MVKINQLNDNSVKMFQDYQEDSMFQLIKSKRFTEQLLLTPYMV